MSSLSVYLPGHTSVPLKILTHGEDISATLAESGVGFARHLIDSIKPGTAAEDVWTSVDVALSALSLSHTYAAKQLIDTQQLALDSYQAEHQRDAQASYWIVGGRVLVYINAGERIYGVECAKNDVLTVPANSLHWLSFGDEPRAVIVHLPNTLSVAVYSPSLLPHQFTSLF